MCVFVGSHPSFLCCLHGAERSEAIGDDVISEIIAATERGPSNHDFGVGGHEAFTSIVFAPKVRQVLVAVQMSTFQSGY